MAEPFIGEIRMFAGRFAPRGWAFADGQLLPIAGHTALFSLLGTTYGGDGRTSFALPDLRGRIPIHQGAGPGLTERRLGSAGGSETVTLATSELPVHGHPVQASRDGANRTDPKGHLPSRSRAADYYSGNAPSVAMASEAVGPAGAGGPHDNLAPFQCVPYIIALVGLFPSRT